MSDGENQNDGNISFKTYERGELLSKVMDKHRRLLDEYGVQFGEIDGKVRSLNEQISSSKEKKEYVATRTEVLTEKRQLFYHQAEKLLDELISAYESDVTVQKELRTIAEEFPKVKSALSPEDEGKLVNSILANISVISSKIPKEQGSIDSFRARMHDAVAANTELSSLKHPEEDFDKAQADIEKELGELNLKYKWLENRISSHKEALSYWEKMSASPAEEAEVKA
jgi:predicted  nucleic acid-binding Zn-ribbon protein